MNKIILILMISCMMMACASQKSGYHSSNIESKSIVSADAGTSFANAIVINEKNESAGVHAEYSWLKSHYSGYTFVSQALIHHGKTPYDVLTIRLNDGTERKIYFDISKFYGKM